MSKTYQRRVHKIRHKGKKEQVQDESVAVYHSAFRSKFVKR